MAAFDLSADIVTSMYLEGATNGRFPSIFIMLVAALCAFGLVPVLVFYSLIEGREKYVWRILGVGSASALFVSWWLLWIFGPMGAESFESGFARWAKTHVDADGIRRWETSLDATLAQGKKTLADDTEVYLPLPNGAKGVKRSLWPPDVAGVAPDRVAISGEVMGVVLEWDANVIADSRMIYVAPNEHVISPPTERFPPVTSWRQVGPGEWVGVISRP